MSDIQVNIIPNLYNIAIQLASTFVLFLIVKHFFGNAIKDYFAKRSAAIDSEINAAKEQNLLAKQSLEKATVNLEDSKKQAQEIVSVANETASRITEKAKENSVKETKDMIEVAKKAIEQEKVKAQSEIKQEIIDLTLASTKQILSKEINADDHQRFLDEFLTETEGQSWKS